MTAPSFGSAFAGIGGFDLGLERAGWRCAWQVESDPACRSVLRRHFPGVPIYEDVREVGSDLEPVDLVCGGFPCQDVSVAGKRAGLAGARSGLWWEFHRIVSLLSPPWVLVENVAGLLSSHGGRDLGAIIGGLADLGYVGSWRVLDSQFFGVAQRRRRVFLVGHLGAEPRPEVLSLAEGLSGHPPPSREAGARVAVGALGSTGGEGRGWRVGADEAAAGHVVAALRSSYGGAGADDNQAQAGHIVGALQSHSKAHGHAMTTQQAAESGHVVAYSLRSDAARSGEAKTPSPDAEGRVRLRDPGFNVCEDFAPTLDAGAAPSVVAAQCHGSNVGPMGTLRQGNGGLTGGVPFVAHTLRAEGFDASEDGSGRGVPLVAHTITGREGKGPDSDFTSGAVLAFQNSGYGASVGERTFTLMASDARLSNQVAGVIQQAIPRRLTPLETSRLQGFPDDWNEWGLDENGKRVELSDSARYRQNGNAVTTTVATWLGRRILAAHLNR